MEITNQGIIEAYRRERERKEELTRFFNKHRNDYKSVSVLHAEYKPKGFYVYEWFTLEPRMVFYVGKGKNTRYNHILKEIEASVRGSGRGSGKGFMWQDLKDNFGIDCHIVIDGLTEEESLEVEDCFIIHRLLENQPLLQHIIPWGDSRLEDEEVYEQWLMWNYPPRGKTHSDIIKESLK